MDWKKECSKDSRRFRSHEIIGSEDHSSKFEDLRSSGDRGCCRGEVGGDEVGGWVGG